MGCVAIGGPCDGVRRGIDSGGQKRTPRQRFSGINIRWSRDGGNASGAAPAEVPIVRARRACPGFSAPASPPATASTIQPPTHIRLSSSEWQTRRASKRTSSNAGLSGETSAGALRRVDWLLREKPDVVVIETGANDGLRGLNPDSTAGNLKGLIEKIRAANSTVRILLVQMEAPTNLRADVHSAAFHALFREGCGRGEGSARSRSCWITLRGSRG